MAAAHAIMNTYENDVFVEDDEPIHLHPHVIMLQNKLNDAMNDLEYHRNLCKQLQSIAITKAQGELDMKFGGEKEVEANVKTGEKRAGGGGTKTRVDAYVEEQLQNPDRVMDEVRNVVALDWSKKKPSRGLVKEYLRAKYHTIGRCAPNTPDT